MKLDDGKPWFRRWIWFGAKPITREGRFVVSIMGASGLLCGLAFMGMDWESALAKIALGIPFAVFWLCFFVTYWKREDPF